MVVVTHEIGFAKEAASRIILWMKEKSLRIQLQMNSLIIQQNRVIDFLNKVI